MGTFKITLIFSDMLGIILPLIWVLYYLRESGVNEIVFNLAVILILLYSSTGNLYYLLVKQ